MDTSQFNWITNYIWGIADDVLRDLYVRGKYRDVILPMTVIRRLDAVLEPSKQAVIDFYKAPASVQPGGYPGGPVGRRAGGGGVVGRDFGRDEEAMLSSDFCMDNILFHIKG